ncbi:MAG TPA: hypothetical protein EYP53_00400 [Candidatus Latescibacteria bacterium]|nr:hypothetical protein [Candidatus Latescibacterota bacterium]
MEIENLVKRSLPVSELLSLLEASDFELAMRLKMDPRQDDVYGRTKEVAGKMVRRRAAHLLLRKLGPAQYLDSERILDAIDRERMTYRIQYLSQQMKETGPIVNKGVDGFLKKAGDYRPERAIITGLGGSGIGALMAVELLNNMGYFIPVEIRRDYPGRHMQVGPSTLMILCSFSGNTEETLFAYECAIKESAQVICIATGGVLKEQATSRGHTFIEIPIKNGFKGAQVIQTPRESVGFSLMIFLSIFSRLGLATRDGSGFNVDELDLNHVSGKIDRLDEMWGPGIPFDRNLAKQAALYFMYGSKDSEGFDPSSLRIPVIIVDSSNASLGVRIENQFGESVEGFIKVLTFAEDIHNEIEALASLALEPKFLNERPPYAFIALRSADEAGRATQRLNKTLEELFQKNGIDYLSLEAEGDTPFERKLYLLKLLDYIRAYACLLRGSKPLPVPFMDRMKRIMWSCPTVEDEHLLDLLSDNDRIWTVEELERNEDRGISAYPLLRANLKRLKNADLIRIDEVGRITITKRGEMSRCPINRQQHQTVVKSDVKRRKRCNSPGFQG